MLKKITFIPLLIILIGVLTIWLFAPSIPAPQPQVTLPDSDRLAERIAAQISPGSNDPTAEIEQPIDSAALTARLSTLTRTVTTAREPSLEELQQFLDQNQQRYRQTDYFSFHYLFFSALDYGGQTRATAAAKLAELTAAIEDKTSSAETVERASQHQVDAQFGRGFSAQLAKHWQQCPPSCWQGPVSGRGGAYLVCLRDYRAGQLPSVKALRDQLINDWRFEQFKRSEDR